MEARSWPIEIILTGTHGATLCNFGDFQEFAGWFLGGPVFTASLLSFEPLIRKGLLRQHPQLADFDASDIDPSNWEEHLEAAKKRFGNELAISPVSGAMELMRDEAA